MESPENDLFAIRDTFRSCVKVDVIYLKFIPPEKQKKSKKGGKNKKKDKGSKSSKKTKDSKKSKDKKGSKAKKGKGKNDDKKIKSDKQLKEEEKAPEEIILKKITLASFYCGLHSVNWSDKTVDYYWAKHSHFKSNALPVEGSLRVRNQHKSHSNILLAFKCVLVNIEFVWILF